MGRRPQHLECRRVECRPGVAADVCDALLVVVMDGFIPAGVKFDLDGPARSPRGSPSPVGEVIHGGRRRTHSWFVILTTAMAARNMIITAPTSVMV